MDIREYIESGILEAYVLGALTREEAADVETNIARYPELAAELQAIEATMQGFSATMAKQPPAGMEDKIWNAIKTSRPASGNGNNNGHAATTGQSKTIPLPPDYRKPAQWKYAAMWIALIGSGVFNFVLWNQSREQKQENASLAYKVDKMQTEQKEMAQLASDYQQAKTMMADTAMQTVVMHTVQKGHPMAATIYWNKSKGVAYVAMNALPPAPKGMQYQLWAMQNGKPVDMGVLPNSMANTPGMQKVDKPIMTGEAFAISLEKEGGSPTPTMERIYVMGKPS